MSSPMLPNQKSDIRSRDDNRRYTPNNLARPSTKPSLPIRLTDIQTYPQGTPHYQSRSGSIQIVIEVGD